MPAFARFAISCTALLSLLLVPLAGHSQAQAPQAVIITIDGPRKVSIDPTKSQPLCGGAGQAACAHQPAKYEGDPQGHCPSFQEDANGRITSVTESPSPSSRQSFLDLGKWQCWTCPQGYGRSTSPVDGDRACQRVVQAVARSNFASANFRGPLCPPDSFFDPIRGGECYSCPAGYRRSAAHIDKDNACVVPAGETFAKATRWRNQKVFWPHDCPGGHFHDGWDGGGCWRCPDGYRRTGFHINDGQGRACVAAVGEKHANATLVKQAKCEAGEFYDMRIAGTQDLAAGGGCWTCPPTMVRGIGAVTSDTACSVEAGLEFKRATFVADLTCPAGQIYDMIKITSEDARTRPELIERRNRKEPIEIDQAGTCWSCPSGYSRHFIASVKAQNACQAGMHWYSAPYTAPGLFGLAGATEVLAEATKAKPAFIHRSIAKVAEAEARSTKSPRDPLVAAETQRFLSNPENSTAAAGVVFTRLVAAIAEPTKASAAERRLVESFKNHVIAYRSHIAQDAIDHYLAWKAADGYWKAKTPNLPNNFLYDVLVPGPDFEVSAMMGALLNYAALEAAGSIPVIGDILSDGLPIALDIAGGEIKNPAGGAAYAGRTAVEIAVAQAVEKLAIVLLQAPPEKMAALGGAVLQGLNVAKAGSTAATGAVKASLAAGPQIIIGASLMIAALTLDRIIEINNALPSLNAALKTAQSDPQMQRLAQTAAGMAELTSYWSYAVAGDTKPPAAWLASYTPMAKHTLTLTRP